MSRSTMSRGAWALLISVLLSSAALGADPAGDAGKPPEQLPPAVGDAGAAPEIQPSPLQRPLESPQAPPTTEAPAEEKLLETAVLPPLGFTGPSSVIPREQQNTSDFVPMEDRWRQGFPEWDRYDLGHPCVNDYPYVLGHWWDPFNQNVLKGDYPIIGQHTFMNIEATSFTVLEARQVPVATTPFESTSRPSEFDFFGRPQLRNVSQYFRLSFELFHGDAGFKEPEWVIKVTPVFNINYLSADELAVVNPDVRKGTDRGRTYMALEEAFVESKIADLSPSFDFVSTRVGSQFFTSDFRGFIFSETNRAVRLFGTRLQNRDQFNLIYFRPAEKDTNSELNTYTDRKQDIFIANYYRQDFIWPGYTAGLSLHFNHDAPSFEFDKNNFLVRPDPAGIFKEHEVDVCYLGWVGDGHINRYNITHAFYWALGHDTNNPIGGCEQDINAQMAALELSYDRDYVRFRTSFLFASGDSNPNNHQACGFDSIFDNPNFAGGNFSYWQRQAIQLFGVNLVQRESLLPDFRSSKIQGQSNFVNPGLWLVNAGVDIDITPKLRMINNINFLWFDETKVPEVFVYQGQVRHYIGEDISMGFEYRPLLSNNIICRYGLATLIPGPGFRDLYNFFGHPVNPLLAGFLELTLTY